MQEEQKVYRHENICHSAKSGVVVEFIETNINSNYKTNTKRKWVNWGEDDKTPKKIRDLTLRNHIAPGLLDFKISATIGKGIMLYESIYEGDKEIKTPVKDAEVEDFLNSNGLGEEHSDRLFEFATDLHWYENMFGEYIFNEAKTKVAKLNHLETYYSRSGPINDDGKVEKIFYGDFYASKVKDIAEISLLTADISKIEDFKYAFHIKKPTTGFLYYPPAVWHSTELWMKVSNGIPVFKASGMANDMRIKYHIKIPNNYFALQYPDDIAAQQKAEKEFFDQLDEFLTGEQNTLKSFATFFPIDPITGKELAGVQIVVIEDKVNYEAHLTDDERATSAICSGHNVNPTLANILIGNKLSSGSEIRNAFEIYVGLYTYSFRQLLLKPLYTVKKINKWNPKIKFGFRDIKLETLDINPTGSTNAL